MERTEGFSVKKEIMNAFMQLMEEKNYMDISVTDIIKKAGVARASFYRNFNTINDVAEAVADSTFDGLVMDVFPVFQSRDERTWREFLFNHFYSLLKRRHEMQRLRFENMSVIFTRIDNLVQQAEDSQPDQTLNDKYNTIGKVGLLNNITKKWLDSGAKETPEEMVDYIMSFITKF